MHLRKFSRGVIGASSTGASALCGPNGIFTFSVFTDGSRYGGRIYFMENPPLLILPLTTAAALGAVVTPQL